MPVTRPQVGSDMIYRGAVIRVHRCAPELLGTVDGEELPHFYRTPAAVFKAGARYIDDKIKAGAERCAK